MSLADLVPAGVNPSTEQQDVLLELAFLTTAADGRLHDDELRAFLEIATRLRGKEPSDAEFDVMLNRFSKQANARDIGERVQTLAKSVPAELKPVAFKLAVALGVADLDASEDESELQSILAEAFGFDDAKVGELTAEVYASLDAGEE
ncbi:MAG: hypothetical protein KIT84_20475 [Labilithrix sp.]|nr:hypothetical protein [Labilithrix sp.]MCW5813416.1 hypothetical protein [Labilithrix sp.]